MQEDPTTPSPPPLSPGTTAAEDPKVTVPERYIWQGKIGPAFWTIASAISIAVNIILIVILLILGQQLFALKQLVEVQLVGGLNANFKQMDEAHIITEINVQDTIRVQDTIQVDDTIPVVFNLPLNQSTEISLIEDTPIRNATVFLNNQPVPTNLILRRGTKLGVAINLTVPVSQTIPVQLTVPVDLTVPVNLTVPVDIPLNETDLHGPFIGLQGVVSPYEALLKDLPNNWQDTPLCSPLTNWFCVWFLNAQ